MKRKLFASSIIFVLCAALVTVTFKLPFITALVFYKENTEQMNAFLPIEKGEVFQIIFTHSIHLTDVVEKYKITDDLGIEQFEIIYEHFGIGMPSNAQEGEEFVYEDGKYHIKNLNNYFPSMNIRNGKTVSENRLVWGTAGEPDDGHMIWFNQYFKPGAWFHIEVEKLTLWEYWKGVRIHE